MSFNTNYQRSKLLNVYYEKIAMTASGAEDAHCPVFTEWAAGFGLVDETDPDNPVLQDIPGDMTEVPREFYRDVIETQYSNGQVICKCEIPVGAVETPQRFNLIGIFDQDGDLVAVCTTLPDWVTPNEADRAYPILTFPIESVVVDDTPEETPEEETDTGETDTGTTDTGSTSTGCCCCCSNNSGSSSGTTDSTETGSTDTGDTGSTDTGSGDTGDTGDAGTDNADATEGGD